MTDCWVKVTSISKKVNLSEYVTRFSILGGGKSVCAIRLRKLTSQQALQKGNLKNLMHYKTPFSELWGDLGTLKTFYQTRVHAVVHNFLATKKVKVQSSMWNLMSTVF